MMFKPWRKEEMLVGQGETWEQAVTAILDEVTPMKDYIIKMNKYDEITKQAEAEINKVTESQEEEHDDDPENAAQFHKVTEAQLAMDEVSLIKFSTMLLFSRHKLS